MTILIKIVDVGKHVIGETAEIYSDEKSISAFLCHTPESRFLQKQKIWEIPADNLIYFLKNFKDFSFKILYTKKENKILKEKILIPPEYKFKQKPYAHQIKAVEYGLNHDKFLLADEQGLGKTKSCIDLVNILKLQKKVNKCLIICGINSAKYNWLDEINKNSDFGGYILGTREYRKKPGFYVGSTKDKLKDIYNLKVIKRTFFILNMESLRDIKISTALKNLCLDKTINYIIFDEIHKLANVQSQQAKGFLRLRPQKCAILSGTPVLNSPLDNYIILKSAGVETHCVTDFKAHYCIFGGFGGRLILGYKNLEELKQQIQPVMLRREKKDCLDLPPKIKTTEFLDMSTEQTTVYNEVLSTLQDNIDKILLDNNPLSKLLRLRQVTSYPGILTTSTEKSIKFDRAEEIIEEAVNNGHKLLIYSNWTEVLNPFLRRVSRYNPAIITGERNDIEEQKQKFMLDKSCKICVGTIGKMGTAHTLTAADVVVFIDEPWNLGTKEQAEDRAHRIGTHSPVNIITLCCRETVDEKISKILAKKGLYSDFLIKNAKIEKSDIRELLA